MLHVPHPLLSAQQASQHLQPDAQEPAEGAAGDMPVKDTSQPPSIQTQSQPPPGVTSSPVAAAANLPPPGLGFPPHGFPGGN